MYDPNKANRKHFRWTEQTLLTTAKTDVGTPKAIQPKQMNPATRLGRYQII
jgi:hypothetical protein